MKIEQASRDSSECEDIFKKALLGFFMVGGFLQKNTNFVGFFLAVQRAPIKPGIGDTLET